MLQLTFGLPFWQCPLPSADSLTVVNAAGALACAAAEQPNAAAAAQTSAASVRVARARPEHKRERPSHERVKKVSMEPPSGPTSCRPDGLRASREGRPNWVTLASRALRDIDGARATATPLTLPQTDPRMSRAFL